MKLDENGPPAVSIGITLEEDGWWAYCPECDIAMGPWDDRAKGAHWRGRHLIGKHAGKPFVAGRNEQEARRKHDANVAAMQRARDARRQATP